MRSALWTLALPAALWAPAAAAEPCDAEAIAARAAALAPSLGPAKARVETGVVTLEFEDSETEMRGFLALQLKDNQFFTSSSGSRLGESLAAELDGLGPSLAGDTEAVQVLSRCQPGALTPEELVARWEAELGAGGGGAPGENGDTSAPLDAPGDAPASGASPDGQPNGSWITGAVVGVLFLAGGFLALRRRG